MLSGGLKHVPPVVSLVGSIHASGKLTSQVVSLSGSGKIDQLGPVSMKYSADVITPSLSVTLGTKRGKIVVVADSLLPLGTSTGTIHYRVIGGTGPYQGATGSGDASVTVETFKGGKETLDVTFP